MTRDVTRLNFYSNDPIDKVVASDIVTYTNDGNTTATGTNDGDELSKIQINTIPNPYGKAALCRYVWSIDGTNFNQGETHLIYSYIITLTDVHAISPPTPALQAAVSIGVSNSTISFVTGNGYHGDVTRLSSDPPTSGYTPISQIFTIKYALFEIT